MSFPLVFHVDPVRAKEVAVKLLKGEEIGDPVDRGLTPVGIAYESGGQQQRTDDAAAPTETEPEWLAPVADDTPETPPNGQGDAEEEPDMPVTSPGESPGDPTEPPHDPTEPPVWPIVPDAGGDDQDDRERNGEEPPG